MNKRVAITLLVCASVAVGIFTGTRMKRGDDHDDKLCSNVASSLRSDALIFEGTNRDSKTHLARAWDFDSYRVGPSVVRTCIKEATHTRYSDCLLVGMARDDWACAASEARQLASAISNRD